MTGPTFQYGEYLITTDRSLLQPQRIHRWLSGESYWAKGIPYQLVQTGFDHSFVIGALHGGTQIAYARLITDYAVFAYLADVYVEEAHRGKGICRQMLMQLMDLDWVQGLRRILLATLDAHEVYAPFGFQRPAFPDRYMEINRRHIYQPSGPAQTGSSK